MYIPYLTAEINYALGLADRQDMHSMCIALRAVITLVQAAGSAETLHRRILGFSISHELEGLQIYDYYPEMNGEEISFFRWPVTQQLSVWENEWTCYRFVGNLDRHFLPIHMKRLMVFIREIPDPGHILVDKNAADLQSPIVNSQERLSYRRTASLQGCGLQAELRNMIQTLQQQLEQHGEREEKLLARLEEQRRREEGREVKRNAREDKLLALLERK